MKHVMVHEFGVRTTKMHSNFAEAQHFLFFPIESLIKTKALATMTAEVMGKEKVRPNPPLQLSNVAGEACY